jgi:plastocyanin
MAAALDLEPMPVATKTEPSTMSHATVPREQTTPSTPHRRRRRRLIVGVIAVVLLLIAVVMIPMVLRLIDDPAASDPVVGVDDVGMQGSAFQPPVIEVPPGTAVTWTFDDGGVEHNVVGDGWQSDVQASGTYQRTFTQPGSYPYACTLHVGMDGRVEVVDG